MDVKTTLSLVENVTEKVQPAKLDWLVTFKDPRELWSDNWFLTVVELMSYFLLLHVYTHAKRRGTKQQLLVLSTICAILTLDLLPHYPRPGYHLWWYHEGILTFLKHRIPAYVICISTAIYYYSTLLTERMNLPVLSHALVTAVTTMAMLFPCFLLAPKYLALLYHFDDPVFKDRVFDVSWSHLTVVTFLFFHVGHLFPTFYSGLESQRFALSKFRVAVQAGVVSMCYSVVEFYLLHIIFKFLLKTSTMYCLVAALVVLAVMAKKEISASGVKGYKYKGLFAAFKSKELFFVLIFLGAMASLPLLVSPENLRSNGIRIAFGNCEDKVMVGNMSPLESLRRSYVCPNDTSSIGFDFHCVDNKQELLNSKEIRDHYTICGIPHKNPSLLTRQILSSAAACLPLFLFVLTFTLEVSGDSKNGMIGKKID